VFQTEGKYLYNFFVCCWGVVVGVPLAGTLCFVFKNIVLLITECAWIFGLKMFCLILFFLLNQDIYRRLGGASPAQTTL